MRQDADRQGGGRTRWRARSPSCSGPAARQELLPQRQGPGAAQQVRRRDRAAHPADLRRGPARRRRDGTPVVVFFDEMDSLFRTRGSGCRATSRRRSCRSCCSEIDGVERLENVIVIGASNREDMIDPAILRPGRLDVKIKIERPDAEAARDIFTKYLTADLPLHADDLAENGGSAAGHGRGDDPAHRRADVLRDRREPLPRGHLRQRRQGGPVLQGLQLRAP